MRVIKKQPPIKILLIVADAFVLLLAIYTTFFVRYRTSLFGPPTEVPWDRFLIYCLILAPFYLIFKINNLYNQRVFISAFEQFVQLTKSTAALTGIYVLFIFLSRQLLAEHRRSLVAFVFVFSLVLLSLARIGIFRTIYRSRYHNGILKRRIIVIGAGEAGSEFLAKIQDTPQENIEIIGFFDDDPKKNGKKILGIPVLGTTDDLELFLKKLKINIDGIYICINLISYENLMNLIAKCKVFGYPVYLDSSHFRVVGDRVNIHEFESLLSPSVTGHPSLIYTRFFKRLMDIILTSVLMIILLPFLLIISLLIITTSKGPVFFKTKVMGRDERPFVWYKFRTMKIGQDPSQHKEFMHAMIKNKKNKGALKIQNDTRVTRIGKYLRKFSLDELPQLFNVLKGQMSLVGPRPCLPYEYELYENWHKKRFSVAPGLTGLWQAFGRSNVSYDDMVAMDLYYIENISFWLDLKILLNTIPVVMLGRGGH